MAPKGYETRSQQPNHGASRVELERKPTPPSESWWAVPMSREQFHEIARARQAGMEPDRTNYGKP